MQGLERVYRDFDDARARVAKLAVLGRITDKQKSRLLKPILSVMELVNGMIESMPEENDGG